MLNTKHLIGASKSSASNVCEPITRSQIMRFHTNMIYEFPLVGDSPWGTCS